MKEAELALLYSYIYNNTIILEDNVRKLQANVRFRSVDIADCVELACAIQRLETFREVTTHIRQLLNIGVEK